MAQRPLYYYRFVSTYHLSALLSLQVSCLFQLFGPATKFLTRANPANSHALKNPHHVTGEIPAAAGTHPPCTYYVSPGQVRAKSRQPKF